MVNVDDERTQKAANPQGAEAAPRGGTRSGQPRGGVLTPFKDEDVDPQEFSKLLDIYDNSFRNIAEGEVMKGTVLKVTPSEVIVDIGYKSEGIIGVDEFLDERGEVTVQPGDTVDVLLERTEDRDGYVVLSREKAEKMKIWDEVEKAYAERKVVIGRVIERIKGGLAVDIGVRAFLPGSQIDVRPVRNLDALRGQELRMRVIKVNKKRGNIVLSKKKTRKRRSTPCTPSRRARSSRAPSRTSPTTARSSTWAASMGFCTSPTCRGAAWAIRRSCSR
jgi:transcriptional accessory protein Tex/SPT6